MIVVDTNLVAYLLIRSEHTERARRVWAIDRDWILPPLWRHELLSVLSSAVRAGTPLDSARSVWHLAIEMMAPREHEVNMLRALELSRDLEISAYDAQFLALAEGLDLRLVTGDRRLRRAAGDRAMGMREFCREAEG